MRALIIEQNNHHDEVMPSIAYLLGMLGYQTTILANRELRKNDIWSAFEPDGALRVVTRYHRFNKSSGWRYQLGLLRDCWAVVRHAIGKDVVVLNSGKARFVQMIRLVSRVRVIFVVHDVSDLNDAGVEYLRSTEVSLVAIDSKVADQIAALYGCNAQVVYPVYLPRRKSFRIDDGERLFCVQGAFETRRRNYTSLMLGVRRLVAEGISGFKVIVVSRPTTELSVFKRYVEKLGLGNRFKFVTGQVPYSRYYDTIAESAFLLFLIDNSSFSYWPYLNEKTTSSTAIAVGLGLVPIISRVALVGSVLSEFSIPYDGDQVYQGMKAAIEMPAVEIESLNRRIADLRTQLLDQSLTSLRTIIATTSQRFS